MAHRKFRCDGCGAHVEFSVGAKRLACPYCGTEKNIPKSEAEVREHDLSAALEGGFSLAPKLEARTVKCGACGAIARLEAGVTAKRCAFCDAPLVASQIEAREVLAPQAILPFAVESKAAQVKLRDWLGSRWFAPSDLERRAQAEGLDGVYLPFFTFDAQTETFYRGQRGDHYYVEQTYTVVQEGESVQKTRRVQHTRWTPRSGAVWLGFDDVLVFASSGLPENLVRKLEPWDLSALVPFDEAYLSGFLAECDQRGLGPSFAGMKARCQAELRSEVAADIGGDVQQIRAMETAWTNVTFKHLLLPVWVGAFRYGGRVFRVVVNARTGEVEGERPWSPFKIGVAIFAAAALVLAVYWAFGRG